MASIITKAASACPLLGHELAVIFIPGAEPALRTSSQGSVRALFPRTSDVSLPLVSELALIPTQKDALAGAAGM